MNKKFSLPRGTKDILSPEVISWQEIEKIAYTLCATYGYKEIRTPIFEETGLFKRSLGQTSDVVTKQLLELKSQKEEGFSLRPEGTASIVRSYIDNRLDKKEGLSKLFYVGPMFRGERPQKGRLRQFHQIGVEAIGPDSGSAYLDAEVIALCVNLLESLGLKDFDLKINTLGSSEDKKELSKFLRKELKGKVKDLCEDCQRRFEKNVFRVLDCKAKKCSDIVGALDITNGYLSEESKEYFRQVKEALDSLNIKYEQSQTLVRGLDYYTHTVFEITGTSLGSQDALGAGGRYNSLVQQLGGPQVDAVGFALGIERMLLAMSSEKLSQEPALDVFVIGLDETAIQRAFQILHVLRTEGVASDMSYRISSVKSQMRLANKSGARFVMILGENELARGAVTLKNMEEGTQEEVKIENISNITAKLIER